MAILKGVCPWAVAREHTTATEDMTDIIFGEATARRADMPTSDQDHHRWSRRNVRETDLGGGQTPETMPGSQPREICLREPRRHGEREPPNERGKSVFL